MSKPITEHWLSESGFKWHQLDRQTSKQWLLWLGDCIGSRTSYDDLGVELAQNGENWWYCWLRSDVAHRYSRFLHIRHLDTQSELICLIEGLTGQSWNPANNLYGSMRTPEHAERLRQEAERLDRRMLRQAPIWREIEKDNTRGAALPEHMQLAIDAGLAK